MIRKLPHLVFALALSGLAALGLASDSDFVADEIRGLHSEFADTRRWVDSDIRANLAHRWETIPNRLAERGFGWAESGLESLSWIPNADLAVESDSAGKLAGFSAGGTGLLWTGESAAVGFQPWGRWTDGGENDAASFGVFSRRALGDWVVVGGNVFADYAASAEFGDFARWSAGLDFQSPLGELRGNYYAGLSSTRENVGLENRALAYAPSGVDAELRLRWFGGSEWSGFAEYEKWSGQFGDADLEEVGYGLSFRPVGGGLLAGLQVDAGFRDSADSAEHWGLRLDYSRRLGADDSVRDSGSAFAVRSALIAPVAREREIEVVAVTVRKSRLAARQFDRRPESDQLFYMFDVRPFMEDVKSRCTLSVSLSPDRSIPDLGLRIYTLAYEGSQFGNLCDTIRMGGDVNARGDMQATPLHRAVNGYEVDNLKLLILAGADVNAGNVNGVTPLDRAQMHYDDDDSFQNQTKISMIAMVLRASNGNCVKASGAMCEVDPAPIYEGGSAVDYSIWEGATIHSTAAGVIWRLRVPGFPGATLIRHLGSPSDEIMIHENGDALLKANKSLGGVDRIEANVRLGHPRMTGDAVYNFGADIIQVPHSDLWSTPPTLKAAHGYTGALFTIMVNAPFKHLNIGFDRESEGILIGHGEEQAGGYREGIFRTGFTSGPHYSPDRGVSGTYDNGKWILAVHRPIVAGSPLTFSVHAYAQPERYLESWVTMAFTISAIAFPPVQKNVASTNHASFSISSPRLSFSDLEYHDVDFHDGLTVYVDGSIGVTRPFLPRSVFTMTAKATSPDFLGQLDIRVEITTPAPPNINRLPQSCQVPANVYKARENAGCSFAPGCELDSRLENAIKNEDVSAVCAAVAAGGNPHYQSFRTMLMEAIDRNDTAMMTVLFYNGANVQQRSEVRHGPRIVAVEYPLHRAAILANYEAGKFLLDNGAYVNIPTIPLGDTPLHAVSSYDIGASPDKPMKFAQLLLDHNAEYNLENLYGQTPLYKIALGANVGPIRPLMQSGANLNKRIVDGRSSASHADYALVQAAKIDHTVAVSIMLEFKDSRRISVDVREEFFGLGAVHQSRSVNMARILADKGANLNLPSGPNAAGREVGLTPLDYLAKRKSYEEVARFLHSRGARCSAENEDLEFCDFP